LNNSITRSQRLLVLVPDILFARKGERTMIGRILFGLTCTMAISLGPSGAWAQSGWQKSAASEDWTQDFTVLTMYGDAWGSATEPQINRAIARAIAACQAMSGTELGCGAYFTSIRAGWSLGVRCGRENIIVADKDLAEAERRALRREVELRTQYLPGMPACVRVVTIDPTGRFVTPELARHLAGTR
jgi:hypothetical protein